MKFEIRVTDWFKRRVPKPESKPVSVEMHNVELSQNHQCTMIATYDDGSALTMTGWVNQNPITKRWTVAGNGNGRLVMCDIIE